MTKRPDLSRHTTLRLAQSLALGLLASGCAEATFSAHTRDNNAADIRRALSAASAPAPKAAERSVAYVVTAGSGARKLVAVDLANGATLWSETADVKSRITVGPGIVVHRQGQSEIVGRDPASGRVTLRVQLKPGERFVGLAVDANRLYYVVQGAGDAGRRVSSVVAVSRSGAEQWRAPATGSLGAPAVRGGVLAVPFHYQNLSLLDCASGQELARVRSTEADISFVRAEPEGIYYGGARGVFRLDEKSASGTRAGSSFTEAQLGSEQVRAFYHWDAYQPAQSEYGAFDRNRLLWHPAAHAEGGTILQDGRAVLHSFRYFFAFDAGGGALRWVYAHPRVDVVASEDTGRAVLYMSADGELGALDAATGLARVIKKTGLRVQGATFDAAAYVPSGTAGEKGESGLVKGLSQIIWDPDARFTAVKVFAVAALAQQKGTEATEALLKVVLKPTAAVPGPVVKRAGDDLVARKDKEAGSLFVEALHNRADYLEGRKASGIDVLARACAAIGEEKAVPDLAVHLRNHETPLPVLKEIAAALDGLGGAAAGTALHTFLVDYHADPAFLADPAPLTLAAEGLSKDKVGGGSGRRALLWVLADPRTIPPLARYIENLLGDPAAKALR